MSVLSKNIENLSTLLIENFTIPKYQRPYKWSTKHVIQLIDDILKYKDASAYRIGTVVLHEEKDNDNNEVLNIVDGQQRLLTLTLILKCLNYDRSMSLIAHKFSNDITINNLRKNYAIIYQKIKNFTDDDKFIIKQFLLEKCEIVVIKLDDISEAFQFFDSQNARGKELEPFDLLKAYHLREMQNNTEQERIKCVEKWEEEISNNVLKKVMNNYLFKIRKWVKHHNGREFTKNEIDVFKGISLENADDYTYLKSHKIINAFIKNYQNDINREVDMQKMSYPFQINQVILNGKLFFEYIEYYIRMYKDLNLDEKVNSEDEILNLLNTYSAKSRTGDKYTRNLFNCGLMFYYDKFKNYRYEEFLKLNFTWSYSMRVEQSSVQLATMDNKAIEQNSIFHNINHAITPKEVLSGHYSTVIINDIKATKIGYEEYKVNANNKGDNIINQFRDLGLLI